MADRRQQGQGSDDRGDAEHAEKDGPACMLVQVIRGAVLRRSQGVAEDEQRKAAMPENEHPRGGLVGGAG